jgi:hypothetical protein
MSIFKDIVDGSYRHMLIHAMIDNESKHIVMYSYEEFHYLEPNGDEFKCFKGVESLRRDDLPDSITPEYWGFAICETFDDVLDIYNDLIKHKEMLAIIPDAEVVD